MGLGFFKQNKLDAMRRQAFENGVRRGDGVYDCESCAYAERANCITGVICTAKVFNDGTYLMVAETYTCDDFKQGGGI